MIVLLELLTVLLEYIDLSVIAILISKNSYYYTNILPIMLALCSMLSGTYYAHDYASIIGGSLLQDDCSVRMTALLEYLDLTLATPSWILCYI